jgi:uncharacterized protein DUF3568
MKNFSVAMLAALAVAFSGCKKSDPETSLKKRDFGTGLNTVERTYEATPTHLVEVVAAALRSYDLAVESDRHDDLGGEIVARRADGSKVTAKITARDEACSEVSVRVEPGNKNMAELLHERIAEKVGALNAK